MAGKGNKTEAKLRGLAGYDHVEDLLLVTTGASRYLYRSGPISIGSSRELLPAVQSELCASLHDTAEGPKGGLVGRAPIHFTSLSGIGSVVIKHYRRGGMLRHLRSSIHLRSAQVRSEREFEVLEMVRGLGIPAPEPIAFAWRGGLWYRAWLVTRHIEGTQTLAEISRVDEERAQFLAQQLVPLVERLIASGIFHIDFHPGNVVVDREGGLAIVDFDKARIVAGRERGRLADRYLRRWRRAVIKHNLSEVLTEVLCSALRRRDLVRR